MKITYHQVSNKEELNQILVLQQKNLSTNLTREERLKEGFVSDSHTFELLQKMNNKCPHIVAKVEETVIGFALCMHPMFSNEIELLLPMFHEIEDIVPKDENYIVMGQICIAKEHRKKGIFKNLYSELKKVTQEEYGLLITEVDAKNNRSINAHASVGFTHLKTYTSNMQEWQLIVLR